MLFEFFTTKPVLIGLHLGFAILGIDAFLWLLGEVQKDAGSVRRRTITAGIALCGYLSSWLIGGYYYVRFYGPLVKPVIKAGRAPWAHTIAMEVKEHIFLFAVPLGIVIFCLSLMPARELEKMGLKRIMSALLAFAAGLGLLIGVFGFMISAAARWGVI